MEGVQGQPQQRRKTLIQIQSKKGPGDEAQWQNTSLACTKSWGWSPVQEEAGRQQRREGGRKRRKEERHSQTGCLHALVGMLEFCTCTNAIPF